MIHFDNITMRYAEGHEALSQVSLRLEQGEMAFLTGHSGAGKSTLLKLTALIERPTFGQLIVNQQNLTRLPAWRIPAMRRTMGIIFQNPYLIPDRRVYDNVALPLIVSGYPHREIGRRVRAALDKVGLLKREKAWPEALSCGEQQRVSIARAVINKPRLLLADEPTGNLDPSLSADIMKLFEQFNQVGVTVLVATHDLGLIAGMRRRIITLKDGRLLNDGLGGRSCG